MGRNVIIIGSLGECSGMPGIYELVMALFFVLGGLFLGFLVSGGNLMVGISLAIVVSLASVLYYVLGSRGAKPTPA